MSKLRSDNLTLSFLWKGIGRRKTHRSGQLTGKRSTGQVCCCQTKNHM